MSTVTASFNVTVRQMTEMSQQKIDQPINVSAKKTNRIHRPVVGRSNWQGSTSSVFLVLT